MNIVKRGKEKNLLLSGGAYRRRSGGRGMREAGIHRDVGAEGMHGNGEMTVRRDGRRGTHVQRIRSRVYTI